MKPTLHSSVDTISSKPPRSKLEPHREFIRQLRRKGCTYRDVARIFRERLGFPVAISTIHSFIKVRAKHRKQVQYELPPLESSTKETQTGLDNAAMRIAAFKSQSAPKTARRVRFHFEESEPLKLVARGETR